MEIDQSKERTWATFCHLAALVGFLIPLGHFLGPLIIWLMKRAEMPLVNEQGREALNFQLSMTLYLVVGAIFSFIGIGILLMLAVGIVNVVLVIVAAIKVSNGESFRYPLTIRLIK